MNAAAKKALALHIVLLVAVVVLTAMVTFAWFLLVRETPAGHSIKLGSFEVHLIDSEDAGTPSAFTGAADVRVPLTAPKTYADALASMDSFQNTYAFEIINSGTVAAMYRFTQTAAQTGADGVRIGEFVRCAVRSSDSYQGLLNAAFIGGAAGEEIWLDPAASQKTSLTAYLDALLLDPVVDGAGQTIGAAGKDAYVLAANGSRYFEILVWLDEDTTVADVGADYDFTRPELVPSLTFTLTVHAMQRYGAYWAADWRPA